VDTEKLNQLLSNSQLFGLLNIFSAGGISTLSIVMLGVGPYITASIIMQLLTVLSPKVKSMYQEEGEIGRKRFSQYSRMIALPLSFVQGFSLLTILQKQGVFETTTLFAMGVNLTIITAGTFLLMWLGEMLTERGIGNGTSMIIFAGIVAGLPTSLSQTIFTATAADIPNLFLMLVSIVVVIAGVVFITEAERPIPITYAKQARGMSGSTAGGSTYIPLRLNQAGVIPIIFALSLFTFPQILAGFIVTSSNSILASVGSGIQWFFQNQWLYAVSYFLLVFGFTYLYTAIIVEPNQMADNLQKSGAFIPGIRPGVPTADFMANVLTRITLVGALFLGVMAVLPIVIQNITGNTLFSVGGTSLLIVVSVVLDIIKKIDAQVSMREY
jgi:preprotein translocase subunit SecY